MIKWKWKHDFPKKSPLDFIGMLWGQNLKRIGGNGGVEHKNRTLKLEKMIINFHDNFITKVLSICRLLSTYQSLMISINC